MVNDDGTGARDTNLAKEIAYNDAMSRRYDDEYHSYPIMRRHTRNFVEYAASYIRPGSRVLDLGCASASLWSDFRECLDPSVTLVGVDVSPEMLNVAREKHPLSDFRVGSMTRIPAEDSEFDAVVVSSAFHHVADAQLPAALSEIHRVLSEHGLLIGREPLATGRLGDRGGSVAGALMSLRHIAYRFTGARDLPEPDPGPDHHAYDAETFLRMIESVFPVADIAFVNPVSHFLARSRSALVIEIAMLLDTVARHKEGQEVHYIAQKNFHGIRGHESLIDGALSENRIHDLTEFLAYLDEAGRALQSLISKTDLATDRNRAWLTEKRIRYLNGLKRRTD